MLLNNTHLPQSHIIRKVRPLGMEVTPASHLAQRQLQPVWEGWLMSLLVLVESIS